MSNRILPWPWTYPHLKQARPRPGLGLLPLITAIMLMFPLAALAVDDSSAKASESEDDASAGTPIADNKTETDNEGQLGIELNKLEQVEDICRVYFVFENATDHKLETLQLELVLFDTKGFVKRRLTLDAAPIAQDKISVKLFDLPETQCTDVGRILVNDVVKIAGPEGALPKDVSQLDLSSKLDADLFK